jgi:hypothetical protein
MEESDHMLTAMELRQDVPTVEELLDSPLSRSISFAANSCGYSRMTQELIVNWVHLLFLQAKAEASTADNLNWWEAMKSSFVDEYW